MRFVRKIIREDLNQIAADPGGPASSQAKRLGLQYVGFGRYMDPNTQQVTHIIQDDKLLPFNQVVVSNSFKNERQDDIGMATSVFIPQSDELHQKLITHYSKTKYDSRELEAIRHFTDLGHIDINDRLSSLPTGIPAHKIERRDSADALPDLVGSIDSALKRTRVPEDFITYAKIHDAADTSQLVPGSTFKFRGFRNTSIHLPNVLNTTSKDNIGISGRPTVSILQLNVKKNSRGLYASDYSPTPEEREFILPRGTQVKVLDKPRTLIGSDGPSGITNLEMKYYNCEVKG